MKKKGLIISTIAMVVVLVVALSTATFAWFSNTATVAVENMQITTSATEGLQIGVNTTAEYTEGSFTNYTYGLPTLDGVTGVFVAESGNEGKLGSKIDFTEVSDVKGSVKKAVTEVEADKAYRCIYTAETVGDATALKNFVGDATLYTALYPAGSNTAPTIESAAAGEAYDLDGTVSIAPKEAFYILPAPGAYVGSSSLDSDDQPKDYNLVSPNIGDAALLELPLAVRPTMEVGAIVCTVTITYDVGTMANKNFAPGMLAATYVEIDGAFVWAPFGTYKATGGEMQASGGVYPDGTVVYSAEGYMSQQYAPGDSASEVLRYVVALPDGTTDKLDANDKPFQNVFKVWIEGEDGECIANTAGSGFTLDFNYEYQTGAATIVPGTDGTGYDHIVFATGEGENKVNKNFLVNPTLTHKGAFDIHYA